MAPATGSGFTEPNEEYALQSFERVLGTEEARDVWDRACTAVGLPQPRAPLSRDQLHRVATYLTTQTGFIGVMGASLKIRLDTYEILSPAINGDGREPGAEAA